MRYTSRDDLPILSAEMYPQDLAGLSYSTQTRTSKKGLPVRTSDANQDGPRKRAKAQPAPTQKKDEHHGEEEEKKRTRGRPRLDVKDETAADRRRTQIRLAQRAYRNRKENAIQTLEQKVQDLKDTNEEMSNVFMQLHDFAMSTGALDRNPEFGRQLRMTTEKFLALARKASEDGNKDDEGGNGSPSSPSPLHTDTRSSPEAAVDIPRSEPERPPLAWGGYIITHEPALPDPSDFLNPFLPATQTQPAPALDFEVITHPTPENASFPFGSSTTPFYPSLPLPSTYSPHEITFGRRLHRFATERALYLISLRDPPPEPFQRVFGFTLLHETRDAIHERTRRTLQRSIAESLAYWPYPFHHLGGAGTHFGTPPAAVEGGRWGNQGTADVMKPAVANGFATGPFTAEVGAVRELLHREGFGGEFFDPEEVELYLRTKGVVIPGGVDEVRAVVDLDEFGEGVGVGSGGVFESSASGTASSPSSSVTGGGTTQPPPMSTTTWEFRGAGDGLVDPAISGMFSQGSDFMGVTTTTTTTAPPVKRATVVVDVNLLIDRMIERGTCLGRTPGFKREDIKAAFWEASRVISS
ncbi:hypothetical protein QBC39DRAFT_247386 [Podospora conica]|nr:hypothetical protein QBC39DRAFT_247386 [Schizothecium conicum]